MNVIGHNHIAPYCDIELVPALCKKNECSVDFILCQEPLSFVRAERDEIQRTRCEDPVQTWWSSSEITLHGESVQQFKQNCSRRSHGPVGRLFYHTVLVSDRPQAGFYS